MECRDAELARKSVLLAEQEQALGAELKDRELIPIVCGGENFEISIADLHCGNEKFKALYRNHGDNFTFFDRRTGRKRTVIEGQPDEVIVKRAKSKVNGRFREIRGRGDERNLEKSACIGRGCVIFLTISDPR